MSKLRLDDLESLETGRTVSVKSILTLEEISGDLAEGQGAALVNGACVVALNVGGIQELDLPVGAAIFLNEKGRSGIFTVEAGNFTTALQNDPNKGLYISLKSDPEGQVKVAKRVFHEGSYRASWFGVKNDGVTDNTQMIQAAVDTVIKVGGGEIHFDRGSHLVVGTVFCPTEAEQVSIAFIGSEGVNNTDGSTVIDNGSIFNKTTEGSIFSINSADSGYTSIIGGLTGIKFKNLVFIGDSTKVNKVDAITGSTLKHLSLDDCHFEYLQYGVNLNRMPTNQSNASAYATIRRCYFNYLTKGWISIKNADDLLIQGCGGFSTRSNWQEEDFIAINLNSAGSGLISGCHFVDLSKAKGSDILSGSQCVRIDGGMISIIGNHFEQNYRDVVLNNVVGGVISGNLFTKGAVTGGIPIIVEDAGKPTSVNISDNTFYEAYGESKTYTSHMYIGDTLKHSVICSGNTAWHQIEDSLGFPDTAPKRGLEYSVQTVLKIGGGESSRNGVVQLRSGAIVGSNTLSVLPNKVGVWSVGDILINDAPTAGLGAPAFFRCTNLVGGVPTWSEVGQLGVKTSVSGVPNFVGQIAVVGGQAYISTGKTAASDWKAIT